MWRRIGTQGHKEAKKFICKVKEINLLAFLFVKNIITNHLKTFTV